jgi:hypothetical protein
LTGVDRALVDRPPQETANTTLGVSTAALASAPAKEISSQAFRASAIRN